MNGTQSIFDAIRAGDADAVRSLLREDPTLLNASDEAGASPVLTAAYCHQKEILALLLAREPELSPFEAAVVGDVERLRAFLDSDPGLGTRHSEDGAMLLHFAAYFGHEEAVKVLVDHVSDVNVRSRNTMNNTPLHAALAGPLSLEGIRALLAAGADVNAKQQGGFTALHSAGLHGYTDRAELLLAYGANPSIPAEDGRTASDLAREKGHHELADRLDRAAAAHAPQSQ